LGQHFPSVPAAPPHGQTVLIHGNAGPALALWAAGLARHRDPSFAWADIAPPPPGLDKVVRLLMAKSSQGAWINGVTVEDVLPPELSPAAVARLLGTAGNGARLPSRLETYLGLPALLQLLAARSTRPDGTATIVVLGTEVLPRARLVATLGSVEVHHILRREGITCIITFEGVPAHAFASHFDQVFHIQSPSAQEWALSTVRGEGGRQMPPELAQPGALRTQWKFLGLPADLLRTWSLPGSSPGRPR
jgi:hypothetical protein